MERANHVQQLVSVLCGIYIQIIKPSLDTVASKLIYIPECE